MRLSIRPATGDDVLLVLADPSDATLLDIRTADLGPQEAVDRFLARVPEADAIAIVDGPLPIAVHGWDKVRGAWYSWLLSTPAMFSGDPAPVLCARRHLRSVRRANRDADLMSIVASDAPEVQRWMRCLGFVRLPERSMNLWRLQ